MAKINLMFKGAKESVATVRKVQDRESEPVFFKAGY
jgi:hypothetical protein